MNHRLAARALFLAVALLLAGPAGAQTTLKIATVVPEGTAWMETLRAGIAEIEERTDGRVRFRVYGGGVQGNDAQVKRKMRIGQLHGGVFTSGGLRAFQDDAEIYGLPRLFRSYEEVRYVRERMDDEIYRRLEEAGFITFGYAGGGFAYLASNTPVTRREDMRQLKFWIPDGDRIAQLATRALGINPVSLPVTDVLTGLQTELIDTVMGPPVGMIVMQWHTAMSHLTDLPLAYIYAGLLLDKRAWDRIGAPDQAVVREVMTRVYRGFDEQGEEDDREALEALLAQGLKQVTVPEEEKTTWERLFRETNESAGEAGEFDMSLYRTIECHLAVFRGEAEAGACGQADG